MNQFDESNSLGPLPIRASSSNATQSLAFPAAKISQPEPAGSLLANPGNLLQLFLRRRGIIALTIVLAMNIASLYAMWSIPIYRSDARIHVEQLRPAGVPSASERSEFQNNLFTQCEVIQSVPIVSTVANAPDLKGADSLRVASSPVSSIRKGLKVSVGTKDDVISVSFETPYKEDADLVLTHVLDSYIAHITKRSRSSSHEMLTALLAEKAKAEAELAKRTRALMDFKRNANLLAGEDAKSNSPTQQLTSMNEALNKAQLQTMQARTAYDRAELKAKQLTPNLALLAPQLSDAQTNEKLAPEKIAEELFAAEQQYEALRAHYMPSHPTMMGLLSRIEQLCGAYQQSLRSQLAAAQQRESELRLAVEQQRKVTMAFNAQVSENALLESEVRRSQQTCDALDTQMTAISVAGEIPPMAVTVLDPPNVLSSPVRPRLALLLFQGALIGGILGCGLALLDRRLRSPEEIAESLSVPILGIIPHLGWRRRAMRSRARVVEYEQVTPAAEAFRSLRTAILFSSGGGDAPVKTILITSAASGEGKSTMSANLAIALARAKHRVLLIDADFHRPRQHSIFDVKKDIGLSDVLVDARLLNEAIQHDAENGLDVMPCGRPPANSTELLNRAAMNESFAALRERYDYILIDSPPVLATADAQILGTMCDAGIIVVRAERTARGAVAKAGAILASVGMRCLGAVINDAPTATRFGYTNYAKYGNYARKPA